MKLSIADRAILPFKPQVPLLTDDQWLLMAEQGITQALICCFWHWIQELHRSCERPTPTDPKELYSRIFGEAGLSAYKIAEDTPKLFYAEMTSRPWELGELGEFGEWIILADIEEHSEQILKAILLSFL